MAPPRVYEKQDVIDEICRLEKELGKPPTLSEFSEMAEMSEATVRKHFGKWNEAKREAGVETYSYYTGGEKGNPKLTKAGLYRERKSEGDCLKCNESFDGCLVFHHLPDSEKQFEVSKFRAIAPSVEALQEEIDKCVILCSNCHRKVHSKNHDMSL